MSKVINETISVFPSKSINERYARMLVSCFTAQLDPTLEELGDIKTAVSEAVTNCIVHGYPDSIGEIKLKCRLFEDGKVEITVYDRGVGIVDIEKARQPMFTTGGEERSGMGFTIMETFSDSVIVRSRPGGGTVVKLTRKLSSKKTI